jgi:hypothetical protein
VSLEDEVTKLRSEVGRLRDKVRSLDGIVGTLKAVAWPTAAETRQDYLRRYRDGERMDAIAAAEGVSVTRVGNQIRKALRERRA